MGSFDSAAIVSGTSSIFPIWSGRAAADRWRCRTCRLIFSSWMVEALAPQGDERGVLLPLQATEAQAKEEYGRHAASVAPA